MLTKPSIPTRVLLRIASAQAPLRQITRLVPACHPVSCIRVAHTPLSLLIPRAAPPNASAPQRPHLALPLPHHSKTPTIPSSGALQTHPNVKYTSLMSKLSPGLQNRLADMEIDLVLDKPAPRPLPRVRSAGLEAHTNPCRVPELSTAKRAATRTSAARPQAASSQRVPSVRGALQGSPSFRENRSRHLDAPQFSFMRDTSSSRKKQAAATQTNKPTIPPRSCSQGDLNGKAGDGSSPGKKRVLSRTGASRLGVPVLPGERPTLVHSSSFSGPQTATVVRPRDDMYTHLYKSAPRSRQQLTDAFLSLTVGNSMGDAKTARAAETGEKKAKPRTIYDVCRIVQRAEPQLFENPHSLDASLVPNEPLALQQLMESSVGHKLSTFERGELMRTQAIYYVPDALRAARSRLDVNVNNSSNNYGFDDASGNYIISAHDHINYRYEIIRTLGTGTFGSVVLCVDHKYSRNGRTRKLALKIEKNKLDWSLQAVSEIKMLKALMKAQNGPFDDHILNYCSHFHFRGHICIVTEALSLNLYQFLRLNGHRGVSLAVTQHVVRKILEGLHFVHGLNMVHCDIKPENIMMQMPEHFDALRPDADIYLRVKIIDFGSSCLAHETTHSYIQSRFYRAPEVILGTPYGCEIDLWSVGCLAAELFTGSPLFPGKSELNQIALFLELLGQPPSRYILRERKALLRTAQLRVSNTLTRLDASYVSAAPDERRLKRTPLYTLFGTHGKLNTQLLTMQLNAHPDHRDSQGRRPIKISTRALDVVLRLATSTEDRGAQANFQRFLEAVFRWDPRDRAGAAQLLSQPFFECPAP